MAALIPAMYGANWSHRSEGVAFPGVARGATDAQRAAESVHRERLGAGDLGESTHRRSAAPLHLPEPILGLYVAEREERVVRRLGEAVGNVVAVADDLYRRFQSGDRGLAASLMRLRHLQRIGDRGARQRLQERAALSQ